MTTIASVSFILSLRSGKRKHSDFQTLPCVIRVRLAPRPAPPPTPPLPWLPQKVAAAAEAEEEDEEEDVLVDDVYRIDALFFRLEIYKIYSFFLFFFLQRVFQPPSSSTDHICRLPLPDPSDFLPVGAVRDSSSLRSGNETSKQ